ncbi:MAG: nitroreductase [Candidatus Lokiarchaeota archaeon]|nr:nitroreductase [Candidatus Lokiarchaeota archaeon]
MHIEEAIYKRRTIRRYKQKKVPMDIMEKLVDYARFAPMGSNIQSLEFIIVIDKETRNKLFPLVSWSAALPRKKRTPEEGRRPMAYIVVLVNTKIKKNSDFDVGAAIENILLGVTNFELGACWMGSIDRIKIRQLFEVPNHYEIKHVISIGYPDEKSVVEEYKDTFKYWKDKEGVMHVPKRNLEDVIFKRI